MTMTNIEVPVTLKPELYEFWEFWNLGDRKYFRTPRGMPTARLVPWIMTRADANFDSLRAELDPHQGGRWVPEGNYVKLQTIQDDADIGIDPGWGVMMSDTPDEMNDHADPILNATGRVLIHGLGLGCVLNCLANKEDVTHIDVVELNRDVAALVMPFFQRYGDKIEFHIGTSCVDAKWPKGARWNYVWHDIWAQIAMHNLTDKDDPENGISYERLHRMFANRCDRQASWAFEMARWQRRIEEYVDKSAARWTLAWNQFASEDERLEMIIEATTGPMMSKEAWRAALTTKHKGVYVLGNQYEMLKKTTKEDMSTDTARVIVGDQFRREAQQKIKRPV